jgi:hypothetical protein
MDYCCKDEYKAAIASLPLDPILGAPQFFKFVKNFGTHFTDSVNMGGKSVWMSTFSSFDFDALLVCIIAQPVSSICATMAVAGLSDGSTVLVLV